MRHALRRKRGTLPTIGLCLLLMTNSAMSRSGPVKESYLSGTAQQDSSTTQNSGTKEVAHSSTKADRYPDGLRRWAPSDSVAVRYFESDTIDVSPDGTRFFFVSRQGDLLCDCNVFELSVFATEDVRRALAGMKSTKESPPHPIRRLIRRSPRHPGAYEGLEIFAPSWERDGQSVSFQGVDEHGTPQIYLFNVRSGAVTPLTRWASDAISMQRVGDTIIGDLSVTMPDHSPMYPVHSITRDDFVPRGERKREATFVSYRGGIPWELKDTDPKWYPTAFSSDGRRAIAIRSPKHVPVDWAAYDGFASSADILRFMLIDAEHGYDKPIFDAPAGTVTRVGAEEAKNVVPDALWAEDQKHVILVNTALPLTPGQKTDYTNMAYVLGYDADSGQWEVIEPLELRDGADSGKRRVTQVGWRQPGKELFIAHEVDGKPAAGTIYTLQGDHWIGNTVDPAVKLPKWEAPKKPSLADGLSVVLRQSANEPPVVMASDARHQLALTLPDPVLEGVWWGRSEPFEWHEPSGKTETGGLMLPRDRSGRVPLVIQAYDYSPEFFLPDGQDTRHAYAAQSLLARGIAVLNVNIIGELPSERSFVGTPQELTGFAERLDSAVDALANRGLIDRSRVGLIGFSRAGLVTYYAITHPGKNPLAAAVIDDGFQGTYSSYLANQAFGDDRGAYEGLYRSSFWRDKPAWLELENSFNVDRVKTPALFTVHSEGVVWSTSEEIGAFALNRRPLEFLAFPEATHHLRMPRQRLASYEASIDWMSFWLNGEIPPDGERARRWGRLREQQQAVLDALRESGSEVAPLPELRPAPIWATEAWKEEHEADANPVPEGTTASVH
jgi:dipeptidyl aminopeptidase/acylaminoacyl peptidase